MVEALCPFLYLLVTQFIGVAPMGEKRRREIVQLDVSFDASGRMQQEKRTCTGESGKKWWCGRNSH
jgi:hypothetical protein